MNPLLALGVIMLVSIVVGGAIAAVLVSIRWGRP